MHLEKLQRANELKEQIERVEERLKIWESAEAINNIDLSYLNMSGGKSSTKVGKEFINFEVLKTLTVVEIKKGLSELKTEFENL